MKDTVKQKRAKNDGVSSDSENAQVLTHRSESKKDHVELMQMRENVKWIIEENEALRQGMQEILDCIHHQDGKFGNLGEIFFFFFFLTRLIFNFHL